MTLAKLISKGVSITRNDEHKMATKNTERTFLSQTIPVVDLGGSTSQKEHFSLQQYYSVRIL